MIAATATREFCGALRAHGRGGMRRHDIAYCALYQLRPVVGFEQVTNIGHLAKALYKGNVKNNAHYLGAESCSN